MSVRADMLEAAAASTMLLPEARRRDVVAFLQGRRGHDGGFKDRAGASDLYYTVFGLEALLALEAAPPLEGVARYLRTFSGGSALDLVHLACLARAWADLDEPGRAASSPAMPDEIRRDVLARIEGHRCPDGGYSQFGVGLTGTAYGCFLALTGYQDLGARLPDPRGLLGSLRALRTADGAYANDRDLPVGLTPATAAAAVTLTELGQPVPQGVADWLLERHGPGGGFLAMPDAPMADLLSTATALHALARMKVPLEGVGQPCAAFVLDLMTPQGGFAGSAADPEPDCEYTYYGLIALGHLRRAVIR